MTNLAFPMILAQNLPHPGHCFKCGSSQRDCVDLGFDAEYYGALLMCVECAHSLSDVEELGFVTRQVVDFERVELAMLRRKNENLSRAKEAIHDGLLAALERFDAELDRDTPEPVLDTEEKLTGLENFYGAFKK